MSGRVTVVQLYDMQDLCNFCCNNYYCIGQVLTFTQSTM